MTAARYAALNPARARLVKRAEDGRWSSGAERLASEEFLRPAGFSVDPRVRAHADTDTLSYVPPEDLLAHVAPLGWEHIGLTGDYV